MVFCSVFVVSSWSFVVRCVVSFSKRNEDRDYSGAQVGWLVRRPWTKPI